MVLPRRTAASTVKSVTKGIYIYSGLDEADQLIYTLVVNASERESVCP